MALVLFPLSRTEVHPSSFLRKFLYSNDQTDERGYVAQVINRARNNHCRIHVLFDDEAETFYGFLALSLDVVNNKPALVLEYLFASLPYRGQALPELEGMTVGGFLLSNSIRIAGLINETTPVEYTVLEPANEVLERYYQGKGFRQLQGTDWMFTKVRS